MKLPESRLDLYSFYCKVYIFVGLCSLAAGVYMFYVNHLMRQGPLQGLGPVALLLVLFGPIRIFCSLWVMRNIRKRTRSAAAGG